jgi:acyl-CoA synthetase (AMP-forming)/AMP-acid ligase II
VKPETRVGIRCEPGADLAVGALAVLKAGGAYLLLHPSNPFERLQFMLNDGGAAVLLTLTRLKERFGEMPSSLPVLLMNDGGAWESGLAGNPENEVRDLISQRLACVAYVSDCSGRPKGVMVTHRNIVNLAQDPGSEDPVARQDIAAASVASSDDALEMWQALLSGGCWTNTGGGEPFGTEEIGPSSRGLIDVGGGLAEKLGYKKLLRGGAADGATRLPFGLPTAGTRIYVLDKRGEPVGPGMKGELYVGGVGVARGYMNDAVKTAERFIPDPYGGEAGARLYRTGDLVRWRGKREVEFLGRIDDQVEIWRRRVDPAEIEARLKECPGVKEVVVVARGQTGSIPQLVAYYTVGEEEAADVENWPCLYHPYWHPKSQAPEKKAAPQGNIELSPETLRTYLLARLPEYMAPSLFIKLAGIPLTAIGKVDRKRLPAPGEKSFVARGYEAPEGEIETALAGIWEDVLQVERVGRWDNFFELGGRSLLAVQVAARVRQFMEVELTIPDIFEHSILSSLAEQIVNLKLGAFDSGELMQLVKDMQS